MTRPLVPRSWALIVLTIAVTPWLVASRIDEWGPAPTSFGGLRSPAIQSLVDVEVVASDRPTLSPRGKRTDGPRLLTEMTPAPVKLDRLPAWTQTLLHLAWAGLSEPFGVRLAGRSPPIPTVS